MGVVRFIGVVVNTAAIAGVCVLAVVAFRRERSDRIRSIWLVVAVLGGALVIGGAQRLLLQAALAGWIPNVTTDALVSDWQFVQSLLVSALVVTAFVAARRATRSLSTAERVAGSLVARVDPDLDISELGLTPRELEVLVLIGQGKTTDAELSEELFVAKSTVQSHVKSLLRKTGLHQRSDLIVVANQSMRDGG